MSETKDIGAAVALEFITTDLQHSSLAEVSLDCIHGRGGLHDDLITIALIA